MIDKTNFRFPSYNPEHLFLFWERVGFCLLQIQSFEMTIEHYLAQTHKLEKNMSFEEVESIYDKLGKLTIGNLFKEILKCEVLPKDLEDRVNAFIKERNWLVHRCRKENEGDIYNESKFRLLYQRVADLSEESLALGKLFLEKSEKYILENGIMTQVQWDIETQKVLDKLGKA